MIYLLNEEQSMLKDSAKEFLKSAPVAQLRNLRDTKDNIGYDQTTWQKMVEMGWAAMVIPEQYEGLNFGYFGLGQILEETGKTLTASPVISSAVMATSAIIFCGSDAQKSEYLPKLSMGEMTATLAIDETARHNPNVIKTHLKTQNGEFLLNGKKVFVPDVHTANLIIATCKDSNGKDTLIAVNSDNNGVSINREHFMDSRNYGTIEFKDVKITESHIFVGANTESIEKVLDISRIAIAAELYGTSVEAFNRTIAYMKERKQFGVELATFQGLQHRCAIMFCELEMAQTAVLSALNAIDQDVEDIRLFASIAKAKVSKVAQLVSNEGVQIFGGIGMTDDEEIGFFLKRARVAMAILGDYNYHLDRFAVLNGY
ncbi:MAG: acyl-CoA dehydrogenase family protein [Saprospiraceae bacterium]